MQRLIRMRAFIPGGLALSVTLGMSGIAYGQNGTQTLDVNVTPPEGSKNAALSTEVAYVPGSDGRVAHATNVFLEFPSEGKISTSAKVKKKKSGGATVSKKKKKKIPQCDPATVEGTTTDQAIAQCGKAQVGQGSAVADVVGTDLPAVVTAFNGTLLNGHQTIVLHSRVEAASLTTVLVGEIMPPAGGGGPYGYGLNVPVPPLAGGAAAIERFQTTVQRKITKDVGYISGKCGADHTYSSRGTFDFSDAPQAVVTDEQTC